jgi:hypothetical protein
VKYQESFESFLNLIPKKHYLLSQKDSEETYVCSFSLFKTPHVLMPYIEKKITRIEQVYSQQEKQGSKTRNQGSYKEGKEAKGNQPNYASPNSQRKDTNSNPFY